MIVSAIVAVSENGVIGKDNELPWYLPRDLAFFKRTTLGRHLIMGRKCYEAIGQPLPKRTNIVLTRQAFFIATGIIVAHSIPEALDIAARNGETEAFIIGGGEIYALGEPYCERIYLTRIHEVFEGDTFFPDPDPLHWRLAEREEHPADAKNPHAMSFEIYERIGG